MSWSTDSPPPARARCRWTITRRLVALVGVAALVVPLTAGTASGAARGTAGAQCPAPMPVSEIKEDMKVTGLTVSRGTKPERFSATVLGVLEDGIAPGVDMIIVEADSPAIDKARGIWGGMSGSPVYARDGRIIGAVAYGFSLGPSKLAGITPAESMLQVLNQPASVANVRPKSKVALPPALQQKLVASGEATPQQASGGFQQLKLPMAAAGMSGRRMAALNEYLAKKEAPYFLVPSSAAPRTPGSASAIVAGGNFAAGISAGDFSLVGVGTATMVCAGRVLAFGHPMVWTGKSSLSAHQASAITVVDDPTFGPYKLANIGGIVGTVYQDRLTAIAAMLGRGPKATDLKMSVTVAGKAHPTAATINMPRFAPFATYVHILSASDVARDMIGGGAGTVKWTLTGRTSDGTAWKLVRDNRYADLDDLTDNTDWSLEAPNQLSTILDNEFTAVAFDSIKLEAAPSETYAKHQVAEVQRLVNGEWVAIDPTKTLGVTAGKKLELRVKLSSYRAPAKFVRYTVDVPAEARGRAGELAVRGGLSASDSHSLDCAVFGTNCGTAAASSFPDLLGELQNAPHNDDLSVRLAVESGETLETVAEQVKRQAAVVDGEIIIGVAIR